MLPTVTSDSVTVADVAYGPGTLPIQPAHSLITLITGLGTATVRQR